MIERDDNVIQPDGQRRDAKLVDPRRRQRFELPAKIVAEHARRPALKWRQIGQARRDELRQLAGQPIESARRLDAIFEIGKWIRREE